MVEDPWENLYKNDNERQQSLSDRELLTLRQNMFSQEIRKSVAEGTIFLKLIFKKTS